MRLLLNLVFYVTFGIIKGITLIKDFVVMIPGLYETQLAPMIDHLHNEILVIANELDPSVYSTIKQICDGYDYCGI